MSEKRAKGATEGIATFGFKDEVKAVDSLEPGDRCRGWADDTDLIEPRCGKPAAEGVRKSGGLFERLALDDYVREDGGWRVMHPLAVLKFLGDEAGVVVGGGALDGVVLGVIGLDEHAACKVTSTGAA